VLHRGGASFPTAPHLYDRGGVVDMMRIEAINWVKEDFHMHRGVFAFADSIFKIRDFVSSSILFCRIVFILLKTHEGCKLCFDLSKE
jgi:hypothetical protein